jgi:hypothetical protein
MTMNTPIDNTNRACTLADLETFGMQLGILCAQRVIRGYGEDPNDPYPMADAFSNVASRSGEPSARREAI